MLNSFISAQSFGIISSVKRAAGTLSGGRSDKAVSLRVPTIFELAYSNCCWSLVVL